MRFLASGRVTVLLVVLCLVLAAAAGVLWSRSESFAASPAPTGAVSSPSAAASALEEVPRLTQRVLSYGAKTLDEDIAGSRKVSTPSFQQQYDTTMAAVRDRTVRDEVTVEARAVGSAVVSASSSRVVALVFVDQTTTARGAGNQRVDQNRVLVTVTRHAGEWHVSAMVAF